MQNIIFTQSKKLALILSLALGAAFLLSAFIIPATTYACATGCPAPTPDVLGTCYPDKGAVNVNAPVTWTVAAAGGDGHYTYSWTGDDGLVSNAPQFAVSYRTPGIKQAEVSVTSGNLTIKRTCTVAVRAVVVPLNVSCVASPSTGSVNTTVTYSATAVGGNGSYAYSWNGADGLSGNSQTVSKQFTSSGTKSATVTVVSNGQYQSASCSSYISQPVVNNLSASCIANPTSSNVGQAVSWSVQNVTGGNGNYTYSWSGTDGLTGNGQTVSQVYNTAGYKTGTVTVNSNGQTVTANCSMNVNGNTTQNLTATCYGNPTNASVNSTVTWYGSVSGGNGNYTYSWSGTDGLFGSNQSVYQIYQTSGSKSAYLTVTSNGQTYSTNCLINVGSNSNVVLTQNPTGTPASGVYLSQVPYTGAGPSLKVSLFILGLLMASAFGAYMIVVKRESGKEVANADEAISMKENLEKFKQENLARIQL